MFYTFLDLLACPSCRSGLVLLFPEERPARTAMREPAALRASPAGAAVGPMPEDGTVRTNLDRLLAARAAPPAVNGRERTVEVAAGLLACPSCERWFPVRDGLPEVLPDHLRDPGEDAVFLESFRPAAGDSGLEAALDILRSSAAPPGAGDPGERFKKAEMSVARRDLPEGFFGPAAVAPFYPATPLFSLDLIRRYAATVPLLRASTNGLVFDLGCGYGWTTEWLVRLGFRAIGLDICRDYILAGRPRMGENLPHLLVGDAEFLPLRGEAVDAALSFDAFHHLPGRRQALSEVSRILKPGGALAMIEPGAGHDHHPRSIAVMKRHGILEHGVDPDSLTADLAGTSFKPPALHPHGETGLVLLTLEKAGVFRTDSRAPRDLVADMKAEPGEGRAAAGAPVVFELTIGNAGDTVWLRRTADGPGTIRLGAVLLADDRTILDDGYARLDLPRDIVPGESLRLQLVLPPIAAPGRYVVEIDPVDEGFLRFQDRDYRPLFWPLVIEMTDSAAPSGGSIGPEAAVPSARELPPKASSGAPPDSAPPRPGGIRAVLREEGWGGLAKKGWRRLRRAFSPRPR